MEVTSGTFSDVFMTQCIPLPVYAHRRNVVIVLHGWLGRHSDMSTIGSALCDMGYRVVSPDLPYHGKSTPAQPATLLAAAKQLITAVTELLRARPEQPQKLAILGYSLGGRLALQMAYLIEQGCFPAVRLGGLVLLSSAPPPTSLSECDDRHQKGKRIAESLHEVPPTKPSLRAWLTVTWYSKPMWGALIEHDDVESLLHQRIESFDLQRREAWERASYCMSIYEAMKSPPRLKVPTLYLHGDEDEKYASFGLGMKELFERYKCKSVEQCGHNALFQRPCDVIAHVTNFMSKEYKTMSCTANAALISIRSVKTLEYALPMKTPVVVNGQEVAVRKGFLVALSSSEGATGVGDVCPLPGLHVEDTQRCLTEIERFGEGLKKHTPFFCFDCLDLLQIDHLTKGLSPACKIGVECALAHLMSNSAGSDLLSFLIQRFGANLPARAQASRGAIRVNGVLPRLVHDSSTASGLSKVQQVVDLLTSSPFHALKLKVGALKDVYMEAVQTRACIQEVHRARREIRLDANRSWTARQFKQFCEVIGEQAALVRFIEEPFASLSDLQKFLESPSSETTLRIGLDENLLTCPLESIRKMASSPHCVAMVLKPSVIGSILRVLELVEISASHRCEVVLSSAFESGVGLSWTAFFAALCSTTDTFHGLGTYRYLEHDLLMPSFELRCIAESNSSVLLEQCQEYLATAAGKVWAEGRELLTHENI